MLHKRRMHLELQTDGYRAEIQNLHEFSTTTAKTRALCDRAVRMRMATISLFVILNPFFL